MTSEPGSFARATIVESKPAIIADVLRYSQQADAIRAPLYSLVEEITALSVTPPPNGIPLRAEWEAERRRWEGRTWLEVPWYFAEAYFYTRLLSAIGYYEASHPDPFASQKADLLQRCSSLLPSLAEADRRVTNLPPAEAFTAIARRSLWGNRVDLSNVAVADRHADDHHRLEDTAPVVDDCPGALALLQASPSGDVTFLCDNSGPELLADLHLADWLVRHMAQRVVLEVKPHPFFVSDATQAEVSASIGFLEAAAVPEARVLGSRLAAARQDGRLVVRDHPYWCGPGHYRTLPDDLRERLGHSALVIAKGDVNYRRCLDDRHWPFRTPIETAVGQFPAPVLLLRTFKGELAAGLNKHVIGRLAAEDPHWLTSGRQGVAQLALV